MGARSWPQHTTGRLPHTEAGTVRALGWREWLSFLLQAALVVGVELGDDFVHGVLLPNDRRTAVANALRLARVESALGLWIEPGLQSFFQQSHRLPHDISPRVDASGIRAKYTLGMIEGSVGALMQQEPVVDAGATAEISHDIALGVDAGGLGALHTLGIIEGGVGPLVQQEPVLGASTIEPSLRTLNACNQVPASETLRRSLPAPAMWKLPLGRTRSLRKFVLTPTSWCALTARGNGLAA
jgi:hypothetical protein